MLEKSYFQNFLTNPDNWVLEPPLLNNQNNFFVQISNEFRYDVIKKNVFY